MVFSFQGTSNLGNIPKCKFPPSSARVDEVKYILLLHAPVLKNQASEAISIIIINNSIVYKTFFKYKGHFNVTSIFPSPL